PRARSSCHNAHRIQDFLEFTLAKHISFVPDLVHRALYTQGGRLRFLASAPLSAPTPSLTPSSPRARGGDIDETARLSRAGRSRARLHRQEPAMRGPRARPDRAESTIGRARDIAVLRRRRALEQTEGRCRAWLSPGRLRVAVARRSTSGARRRSRGAVDSPVPRATPTHTAWRPWSDAPGRGASPSTAAVPGISPHVGGETV